ncbi:MAG: class I SAM-dependent methyltransferase [Candidatus Limnocylindrales bacterium]
MVFRASFDCLWCGAAHAVRSTDDLEGYAQLCPTCIGRAGDNGFLRFRLKAALAERASAALAAATASAVPATPAAPVPGVSVPSTGESGQSVPGGDLTAEMIAYYAARAPEYDDWYLRTGRYSRGPVHDLAWNAELDQATLWLDSLPFGGDIVELAAGTGWWSTLLASKGVLSIYDANEAPLDRARARLVAHGLRAHIHVRDAWAEPDRAVQALFCGFWLSHVPRARLAQFLGLARRWLTPGGMFAFIDSRPDPQSGAVDQPISSETEVSIRRLADGREFEIVKVYWQPDELEAALRVAGFRSVEVTTTARFFILGRATA